MINLRDRRFPSIYDTKFSRSIQRNFSSSSSIPRNDKIEKEENDRYLAREKQNPVHDDTRGALYIRR